MTYLETGLILVAAMATPYLVAAALSAACPRLRSRIEHFPRTDQVVARYFDRTALDADPATRTSSTRR